MKITNILVNICCTRNEYGKCEIDYLISEAKFSEKKELKRFKKMIEDSYKEITQLSDDIAIEIIKSKLLLKLVIKVLVNEENKDN